jgi:HSP20 family protein
MVMKDMMRWNPVNDLLSMDRFFEQPWPRVFAGMPALDMSETDDMIKIEAELPGFTADQIDIKVEGNVLHLKGEQRADQDKHEGEYHLRERKMVSFQRSLTLPVAVKAEKAEAHFENGVLTLKLPKDESSMPKRIKVVAQKEISAKGKA